MKNIVSTLIMIISVMVYSESFSQKKVVLPHNQPVNNSEYLTDQSGNTYKTVKIGSNVWMAENFKGKNYSNGSAIEEYKVGSGKSKEYREPLFCILKNNHYVYSWAAINNSIGIAPTGWHVPSKADWEELISVCNNSKDLKSISGWPVEVWGGIYQTVICPNCKNWNAEYRSKVACHKCKDTRQFGTKYIPKKTVSFNGTNRLNFNIKHMGYLSSDDHVMGKDAYWSITPGDFQWSPFVFFIESNSILYDKPYLKQIGSQGGMLPLRLVKNKPNQDYTKIAKEESNLTKIPVVNVGRTIYFNNNKDDDYIDVNRHSPKMCDEFPFGLKCVNDNIGEINQIFFNNNRGNMFSERLLKKLKEFGYIKNDDKDPKITKDMFNEIIKNSTLGVINQSPKKSDDFPYGLECVNDDIGEINEIFFNTKRGNVFSERLLKKLKDIGYIGYDDKDPKITQDIYNRIIKNSTPDLIK